jgi:hypothetical protein
MFEKIHKSGKIKKMTYILLTHYDYLKDSFFFSAFLNAQMCNLFVPYNCSLDILKHFKRKIYFWNAYNVFHLVLHFTV